MAEKRIVVEQLPALGQTLRAEGRRIVWTNGCFDLVHAGHAASLARARREGHVLVVGLNGDASVRALKGPDRPFLPEHARAALLAAMEAVDYVVVFSGTRCVEEIRALAPDVWVKSGDYTRETLDPEERRAVEEGGGRVVIVPFVAGFGTTQLMQDIRRGDPEKVLSAAFGFLRDDAGRLLLVRNRYNHGDRWGLPGGAQNRYETLPDTMVREMREETGLRVRVVRLMGVLERVAPERNRHLVSHLFEVERMAEEDGTLPEPRPNPSEHTVEVGWFDAARLTAEAVPVYGRASWLRYLAAPDHWPPHVLLTDADE